MNKEIIKLGKDNSITVTAMRDESARCRWSICVFTSSGSVRSMHMHDSEAYGRFILSAVALAGIDKQDIENVSLLVNAVSRVTLNSLYEISGVHEKTEAICGNDEHQ